MKPVIIPAMKDALPVIRAAFEAYQLQAQISMGDGLYSGPCAIGVSLPFEDRKRLDDYDIYLAIDDAVDRKVAILTNPEELPDFDRLQQKHDSWLQNQTESAKLRFVETLEQLEQSYG